MQVLFWGGGHTPMPNPQPGEPECPFLYGSSPLTCLAWVTRDKMPMPLHSDCFVLSPMQQIMKTIPNKILNNMITIQILDVAVALGCLTHCSSLPTKALLSVLFPLSFSLPASVLLHVPKQFHYHIHQVLVWQKYN